MEAISPSVAQRDVLRSIGIRFRYGMDLINGLHHFGCACRHLL
ncbi:hypothetical protein [Paenibacillus sp. Z3-2]